MYDDRGHKANSLLFHSINSGHDLSLIGQSSHEIDVLSPPVSPLDFPKPVIGQTEHWKNVPVVDHITGGRITAKNILVPLPALTPQKQRLVDRTRHIGIGDPFLHHPNHAYLTKKRIAKSSNGQLRLCILLRPRSLSNAGLTSSDDDSSSTLSSDYDCEGEWETTDELVVLKVSQKDRIRRDNRGVFSQDPFSEVAAQQYVGNYHPHVLGCHEAFQDDQYIYTVLPYCPGRDLHSTLVAGGGSSSSVSSVDSSTGSVTSRSSSSSSSSSRRLVESHAREWFGHLLEGISHLQKKGICHGGLCLENILIDIDGNLVLSDFGLARRIPYVDESNMGGGGISDVSEGTSRRLIQCCIPQNLSACNGGNPMYMAPELVHGAHQPTNSSSNKTALNECCFDGFAVDLWALGVSLFVMLTGSAPFSIANELDSRFVQISIRGNLHKLPIMQDLSSSVVHLLQNMLWENPSHRLSLGDLLVHPWVNPPDLVQNSSFEKDMEHVDEKPQTKKRIHHLSFYQLRSLGGGDTVVGNCRRFGRGRDKPLASQRMASF